MVGWTGKVRPRVPRASDSPHRCVLQFFVSAGCVKFPARMLKTRAADKLSKGKEVRVFLEALDGICGVGMSKAKASREPNCVTDLESLICNHCNPPSGRFVYSVVIVGALRSHRSPSRKRKVWPATEDCAQRRSDHGARYENEQKGESLQSVNCEQVPEFGTCQIEIERSSRLLNQAGAGKAMSCSGMQCGLRFAFASYAFRGNPTSHRLEGYVRGLKLCR